MIGSQPTQSPAKASTSCFIMASNNLATAFLRRSLKPPTGSFHVFPRVFIHSSKAGFNASRTAFRTKAFSNWFRTGDANSGASRMTWIRATEGTHLAALKASRSPVTWVPCEEVLEPLAQERNSVPL